MALQEDPQPIEMPSLDIVAEQLTQVESEVRSILSLPICAALPQNAPGFRKGKMLRPILTLLSASVFSAPTPACVVAAAALEGVHLASLLHDDVVDATETRRGFITLNASVGNKCSILYGDYVLAQATQRLSSLNNIDVVRIMAEAAAQMSLGQLMELKCIGNLDTPTIDYLEVISGKTASLLAASCGIGSVLAGANSDEVAAMVQYGQNLGLAFQIADDILDIWGDTIELGKPILSDLRDRKYTLPLLLALEDSSAQTNDTLRRLLSSPISDSTTKQILHILDSLNIKEHAFEVGQQYTIQAMKLLRTMPSGTARAILGELATWALYRTH